MLGYISKANNSKNASPPKRNKWAMGWWCDERWPKRLLSPLLSFPLTKARVILIVPRSRQKKGSVQSCLANATLRSRPPLLRPGHRNKVASAPASLPKPAYSVNAAPVAAPDLRSLVRTGPILLSGVYLLSTQKDGAHVAVTASQTDGNRCACQWLVSSTDAQCMHAKRTTCCSSAISIYAKNKENK